MEDEVEKEKKIKRFVMRSTGQPESKGFWLGATKDGISLGPISDKKEDLHLTIYSKDGMNDAHLTNIKGEYREKETLTHLPDSALQEKMGSIANEALQKTFRILPPDEEVITFSPAILQRGQELIQKIFQIVEKGKNAYLNIDGATTESELQELTKSFENELVLIKVKDLIQMGIKAGFTKDGKLVIVTEKNALTCNFDPKELDIALDMPGMNSLENPTVEPIVRFLQLLGLKQLTDTARQKGLL